MFILVNKNTEQEVYRWRTAPKIVTVPGSADKVSPCTEGHPLDIGPDHLLIEATVTADTPTSSQKMGTEQSTIDVSAKTVALHTGVISKTSDDLMRDWQNEIAIMDTSMPRFMEDHIKNDHGGVAADPFQQAKYDAKAAKRNAKP